jgi:hypothetical protein
VQRKRPRGRTGLRRLGDGHGALGRGAAKARRCAVGGALQVPELVLAAGTPAVQPSLAECEATERRDLRPIGTATSGSPASLPPHRGARSRGAVRRSRSSWHGTLTEIVSSVEECSPPSISRSNLPLREARAVLRSLVGVSRSAGGIAWLMGKFAMPVDNLLSAEVALASSEVVIAREGTDPDLALRGGRGQLRRRDLVRVPYAPARQRPRRSGAACARGGGAARLGGPSHESGSAACGISGAATPAAARRVPRAAGRRR